MAKLKWNSVHPNVYTSKHKNFIFKLEKGDVGVYGMGGCFRLSVRKSNETKFTHIKAFWTSSDGGYNTYQKEGKSVDNKLWDDIKEIQIKSEEILINEFYV